jgi:hypothetical protein
MLLTDFTRNSLKQDMILCHANTGKFCVIKEVTRIQDESRMIYAIVTTGWSEYVNDAHTNILRQVFDVKAINKLIEKKTILMCNRTQVNRIDELLRQTSIGEVKHSLMIMENELYESS